MNNDIISDNIYMIAYKMYKKEQEKNKSFYFSFECFKISVSKTHKYIKDAIRIEKLKNIIK